MKVQYVNPRKKAGFISGLLVSLLGEQLQALKMGYLTNFSELTRDATFTLYKVNKYKKFC